MTNRYACSFRGQCEPDRTGQYSSHQECQNACFPVEQRDLLLLIYQNNPEDALALAPSDRITVLLGLTGERYPSNETYDILRGLVQHDVGPLFPYSTLMALAQNYWGSAVYRTALLESGNPLAFRYLNPTPTQREAIQFAKATLFRNNVQGAKYLYDHNYDNAYRYLSDIFLQPFIKPEVLRVLFQRDGDFMSEYVSIALQSHLTSFVNVALEFGYTTREEIRQSYNQDNEDDYNGGNNEDEDIDDYDSGNNDDEDEDDDEDGYNDYNGDDDYDN